MSDRELLRYVREAFRYMDRETQHISFEEMTELATGQASEMRAAQVQSHLAACEPCRKRLREFEQFVKDCEHPTSVDLSGEWRELQRKLRPGSKKVVVMRRWLPAFAAAVIAFAVLSWLGLKMLHDSGDPQRLLAEAYRQQRSSEFRLAGAGYSTVRQQRGNQSAFGLPGPLLTAQARLAEELKSNPNNPELLRLQGEAEMMAGDAGSAVRTLEKANDLRPQDAHILADLGSAYALRGDAERQFGDYTSALEYLSRSLHQQPQTQEVMFNRALVLERMMLFDQAIQEWQNYLKTDGSSEWANEAREHLVNLQKKMKAREDSLHEIQSNPAQFLTLAAGHPQSLDVEAYLRNYAVAKWLPLAASDETARNAVNKLAEMLQQHGDRWLTEMSSTSTGPGMPAALEKLADAEAQSIRGETDAALAAAQQADHLFLLAGSQPASFRARFTEVVILHNSLRSNECLAAAKKLASDLEPHPYIYIRSQLNVEQAICAMRVGRLREAAVLLRQAIAMSQAAGFGATALRANNMYLGSIGHIGLESEVFSSASQSLNTFWSGAYPPALFHQVVDELRDIAERAGLKHAAWFLARSAAWAAVADASPVREAMARANLAVAAQAVGEDEEARENLEASDRLFTQIPRGYRLEPQISLANVELQRGEADSALARMERIRGELYPGASLDAVSYYSALGEACRRKGLFPEAINAFNQSILVANQRLASLTTERERAGVIKTVESSYRGIVAIMLLHPSVAPAALHIWQTYRALDSEQDIHQIQPADGPVLWFIELPEGFAAWFVRKDQVSLHRLDVTKDAASAVVVRFRRECSDPEGYSLTLRTDAQQLYQWMIEPFAAQLTAQDRNLTVDLDGIFASVPMQALLSPSGEHLGGRFSIMVSSGYAARLQPLTLGLNSRILVMANPAITGESAVHFPPLSASLEEAEAVHATFSGSTILTGRDATLDALLAALPQADAVHFAGHGYTNSDNGALLFAANASRNADYDMLQSADLQHQDWSHCRLVVLSACATAAGETRGAHNPDSLVRALTKAGTPRVVASLWNVDSSATAELMKAFYAALARGKNPGEALRDAQQQVRQHPEWERPYYWAGFQLYGTM